MQWGLIAGPPPCMYGPRRSSGGAASKVFGQRACHHLEHERRRPPILLPQTLQEAWRTLSRQAAAARSAMSLEGGVHPTPATNPSYPRTTGQSPVKKAALGGMFQAGLRTTAPGAAASLLLTPFDGPPGASTHCTTPARERVDRPLSRSMKRPRCSVAACAGRDRPSTL